jgi:hypothetical protein
MKYKFENDDIFNYSKNHFLTPVVINKAHLLNYKQEFKTFVNNYHNYIKIFFKKNLLFYLIDNNDYDLGKILNSISVFTCDYSIGNNLEIKNIKDINLIDLKYYLNEIRPYLIAKKYNIDYLFCFEFYSEENYYLYFLIISFIIIPSVFEILMSERKIYMYTKNENIGFNYYLLFIILPNDLKNEILIIYETIKKDKNIYLNLFEIFFFSILFINPFFDISMNKNLKINFKLLDQIFYKLMNNRININ